MLRTMARRRALVVADMPYGSYHADLPDSLHNAMRFVKEAGAEAVKVEGGERRLELISRLTEAEIPVMGHVGLTPQTATALGGYRAQGRTAARALTVARDALALQEAGCFSLVFEAIPTAVAQSLMPRVEVPVIGIGAGPATDGQVLVFHDLLGIYDGHAPRFAKRYGELREQMISGVATYAAEVRSGAFPGPEHVYSIDEDELRAFEASMTTLG